MVTHAAVRQASRRGCKPPGMAEQISTSGSYAKIALEITAPDKHETFQMSVFAPAIPHACVVHHKQFVLTTDETRQMATAATETSGPIILYSHFLRRSRQLYLPVG